MRTSRAYQGVIRLHNFGATSKNVSIFQVKAFEKLGVPLIVCKQLRVVEVGTYLEKAGLVEHDIPLIFHARHCRDIDKVF